MNLDAWALATLVVIAIGLRIVEAYIARRTAEIQADFDRVWDALEAAIKAGRR